MLLSCSWVWCKEPFTHIWLWSHSAKRFGIQIEYGYGWYGCNPRLNFGSLNQNQEMGPGVCLKLMKNKIKQNKSADWWLIFSSFSTSSLPLQALKPQPLCLWDVANRVVCVHVWDWSIIKRSHLPQCWVLLQRCTVEPARPLRERPHSSVPPDSKQKGSVTSGSGYCAPFVLHHWSRTENGPGGNSTPHPHVSHHAVEVTVTGKLSCPTKRSSNKWHDFISTFMRWTHTNNI